MYLIYTTLCYLAAIISCASGYVMLAANIEDVRSLADRYIPESIADEILNRARDDVIRDRHKQYENERAAATRGRLKINEEERRTTNERATTYSYKHGNRKSPSEVRNHKSHLRIAGRNDTKKRYPSYEMNLDDLVAKVKKRLQIELKLIEASADKHVQARYKKQSRDDAEETIRQIDRLNHNINHRPHSQQSPDDSRPYYHDRFHIPKTEQSRDDTEHTNRQIERPSHHDYDHKPESQKYNNDDHPAHDDRNRRPEQEQPRDSDRPKYLDHDHKSKTQQSHDADQPNYHDRNRRPEITKPKHSKEDDRPVHHDRDHETDKDERQKRIPPKFDHHSEENRSREQNKHSDSPMIKTDHNRKTTDRRERTTTEDSPFFEKVELGKSKESSEKEKHVTSGTDKQSPRYNSKTSKRIDSFAEVKSPKDDKYKVLSVFSDEEPTKSKNKEGVYYYDETLNYDKTTIKKHDNKNAEKTEKKSYKPVLKRDADNRESVLHPYEEQLELVPSKKPKHETDTVSGKVNDDSKNTEQVNLNKKKNERNTNKSVRKVIKATVIPKRDFYKLSSPNYLLKMPIIGERYHFDEPIPEEDRRPEDLKYIGNPPASINGKVVFSQ